MALYNDAGAYNDDAREATTMLEELERTARRVLGGAHPVTGWVEAALHNARANNALHTHEAFARR